ncbi:P-type conjugative transfer protein TrbL [uncultured Erythrobacter sp.]|uniref:P-type conjugative transfer protein TrbL n=1 Tax=uncultured Erythrobacter sp. TaxID=263913 RepID=UPI002604F8C0|nr:P-type conjugative transfer protein TrbL [uncultured Erythrobacter sp.]
MDDLSVIDTFTATFVGYIESGFGLLGPDVAFLTTILIGIDITLAGLFWALSDDRSIIPALIRKVLYVGAFAFILNNFNLLANIIFDSFAGLGLRASGSALSADDLMRPGFVANAGFEAANPLLTEVGDLLGPVAFFENFVLIAVLMFAWAIVLLAFFILAVQLFITILEFKLTTLAGFILVPFALWGKTAFLAERVLGNVIASGIKLMVLAVIVGIGSTIFGTFAASFAGGETSVEQALATVLGAVAIFGLGIFGPGIAAGLVSGAPQLGAGAAVGTAGALLAGGVAGGSVALAGGRAALGGAASAVKSGASMAGSASTAYTLGRAASGQGGMAGAAAGLGGVARAGGDAVATKAAAPVRAVGNAFRAGQRKGFEATGGKIGSGASASSNPEPSAGGAPAWARKLRTEQRVREAGMMTAHAIRDGDRPGSADAPRLKDDER